MFRHDLQHTSYSTSIAPNTNQTLWVRQFSDWVRSSPAVHNGVVFAGSDENIVYALNASTGTTVWTYTTLGDIVSSVAVANNRVYVTSEDRRLYSLDEATGAYQWSFQTTDFIDTSPAVSDGRVVFGSGDYRLYCMNASTGSPLWNFTTQGKIFSSPAIAYGKVFFGSFDRKIYALDLITGSLVWNFPTLSSVSVSPAVANGRVFIAAYKSVLSLDATNGRLLWNYTTDGVVNSSPAVVDGTVYIGSNDYNLYSLNASTGVRNWNFTTGGIMYSSPAVASGKVFFGSDDQNVYSLNATDGTLIWKYFTGGYVKTSSPAVANKVVYIGTSCFPYSGRLFAFGPANAPPVASNLKITPSAPLTTSNLVGSYDYYDEEGSPESGTTVRWYMNSVLQPALNNTLTVPYTETAKGQVWYFTVRPKDGMDFGQTQTSPSVQILNSPPDTSNLAISPSAPYTSDNLTATYIYSDADGDAESGTQIRWYRNGALQPSYNNSLVVPSAATAKGETWFFTVRPRDGTDFGTPRISPVTVVLNSPPSIVGVAISPKPAYASDTLVANPEGWFDADGDAAEYRFQWQKYEAGTWQNITGAVGKTLSQGDFVKGDAVRILCVPFDGETVGEVKMDSVVISNSAPAIDSYYPSTDPTLFIGENQEFNITKSDIDLDPLLVKWELDGTVVQEGADSYVYVAGFRPAGTYNVTVTVSDGIDQASREWLLTLLNVRRDVAVTGMALSKTVVAQGSGLIINVTVENQGDYTETFNVTVYANSTAIRAIEVTLTNGTSQTFAFAWNTTALPIGRYTVSAVASPVHGEADTGDNTLVGGSVAVTIIGDIDGDFDVDILDVVQIAASYGYKIGDSGYNPNADLNGDGRITILDVVTCTLHYGQKA